MLVLAGLLTGCGGGGGSSDPAATPPATTAFPRGNVYNGAQTVSLQVDAGVATYYTLDDTAPSVNSPRYTGPITVASSRILRFFSVDDLGNGESVNTESYQIIDGPLLRLVLNDAGQPLSGMKVELTLPEGVTVATNGDGSVKDGVVAPSGNTFQTGSVMDLPGALSYEPTAKLLTFTVISQAASGFGSGEFASVVLEADGALPASSAFSASLAPVDLLGKVMAAGAMNATFQVEP